MQLGMIRAKVSSISPGWLRHQNGTLVDHQRWSKGGGLQQSRILRDV